MGGCPFIRSDRCQFNQMVIVRTIHHPNSFHGEIFVGWGFFVRQQNALWH